MKKSLQILIACMMAFSLTSLAQNREGASSAKGNEGFYMRNGQVMYIKGGLVNPLTSEQVLPDGTRISTNGKVDSPGGGRSVMSAELIGLDGKRTGIMVSEHITLRNGQAVIMTNDIATPIEEDFKIGDGVVLSPNGAMSNGSRLQEGAKLSLPGQSSTTGNPTQN